MASRSKNSGDALNPDDIGELIDDLQKRIDRCKVLFEQYFLGIQRTAPNQLHVELERKVRQLTQVHIRNTGQRYRFTTLSQKFASYNTYWKRTMRQIEAGTYIRDMARLQRKASRTGKDVPDEVLAKMPKRMRDRILKDRQNAVNRAAKLEGREQTLRESGKVRDNKPGNVHQLDDADLLEDLDSLDLDSIFSGITGGASVSTPPPKAPAAARPSRKSPGTDVDSLFAAISSDTGSSGSKMAEEVAVPTAAAKPRPSRPVQRPAQRPPPVPGPPAIKPPPGMSVSESQALYKRYKKARELVGENTANLSYDKLMRSLNKQAPKILKDHKAQGVSFNVVVKGDRVVLKAKPKK